MLKNVLCLCLFLTSTAHATPILFAVNGNSNAISLLNPDTGAVINTFATPEPTSQGPDGLTFSGSSLFYVSGFESNTIFELNPITGAVSNSFAAPAGTAIDSLAFGTTSFGDTLFALDFDFDTVYLLNPATGSVFTSYTTTVDLIGGMDVNPLTNTLFASDFSTTNLIYELNPETGAVIKSFLSPGTSFAISGLGFIEGRLFASNTTDALIFELNPATGIILNSFASPDANPSALAGGSIIIPEPTSLAAWGLCLAATLLHTRRRQQHLNPA